MAEESVRKQVIIIGILCLSWYLTSSCNNLIGKILLTEFPYPMTVTIVQLLSITLYSGPALKCMGVQPRKKADISWSYYKRYVIPLSLGKFTAVVLSHVSLWKVPVSYGHTVKSTMPLFIVIISRICFNETPSTKVYASLLPIVVGVGIATITELSFNIIGLLSALGSTCLFAFLSIYSKKVLSDTSIHHLRLLHLLGKLAFLGFLPVWLIGDGIFILNDEEVLTRRDPSLTLLYLFVDGFLNWMQNFIAFALLSRVSPLTYSVANASKRIFIITVSLFMMGNPVTVLNICGMLLAIFGVFVYNKIKYDDNKARKKADAVPLSQVVAYSNGGPNAHLSQGGKYSTFSELSYNDPKDSQDKRILNGFAANGIIPTSIPMSNDSLYFANPLQVAPFHSVSPVFAYSQLAFQQNSKKSTSEFH